MKIYLVGKIVYIGTNYVILDVNNVGYKLMVINTNNYHLQEIKNFIYLFSLFMLWELIHMHFNNMLNY